MHIFGLKCGSKFCIIKGINKDFDLIIKSKYNMENTNTLKAKVASLFRFHNIPFIGAILLLFLIPIFFIPSSAIFFGFSKAIILYTAVVISLVVSILLMLKKGQFELPTSKIYLATLFVPLSFLVSALFSPVPSMSFFGYGFEVGTAVIMIVFFAMMFLYSIS